MDNARTTGCAVGPDPRGPGPHHQPPARPVGRATGIGCVLILDVHPLFSRTLRPALREEGMEIHEVGPADEQVMVAAVEGHGAGVVLLELAVLETAPSAGPSRVRTGPLVAALTATGHPVLAVRGSDDEGPAACAVASGAVGVLSKDLPLPELVDATVRAGTGQPVMSAPEHGLWISRHHERGRRRARIDDRLRRLPARERELLGLLATGRRATDIAAMSGAAPAAVRAEIRSMMATLEVGSQIEAVAMLLESRAEAR